MRILDLRACSMAVLLSLWLVELNSWAKTNSQGKEADQYSWKGLALSGEGYRELNRSLPYQHVPIPARTTLCRKGCCTVTWCPLEISWATTIHKFQGFEAGFDINDVFRHLIVDPGDLNWEQMCPGALYVALSRAKTMGTFRDDTSFPQDSAIYWYGSGLSTARILNGHLKKNTKKADLRWNVF